MTSAALANPTAPPEMFWLDRDRAPSVKIGVLELDNGQWLALPPGFHVDAPRFENRDAALTAAVDAMVEKAQRYAAAKDGEGISWTRDYADAVIRWATSIKPKSATKEAKNIPENILDPIVSALLEAHRTRKIFPGGHTFSMTNPVINGHMVTLGRCSCGETFSYAYGSAGHERMDAAIEAHWQKFDDAPDKIDGRGQPIKRSDGSGSPDADSPDPTASRLQQGKGTPTTAGTAKRKPRAAKVRDGGNVANPAATSDRALHVAPGPSDTEPGAGGHPAPLASAPEPGSHDGADAVLQEAAQICASSDEDATRRAVLRAIAAGETVDGEIVRDLIGEGYAHATTTAVLVTEEGQAFLNSPEMANDVGEPPGLQALTGNAEADPVREAGLHGGSLALSDDDDLSIEWPSYDAYLEDKIVTAPLRGIEVSRDELHPWLKPHCKDLTVWALRLGCAAIFANFGLHKTAMQLEWVRQLQRRFDFATLNVLPLGVRHGFIKEALQLSMDVRFIRSNAEYHALYAEGVRHFLTNYESIREGKLDPNLFGAASLDEASCFPAGTLIDTPVGTIPIEKIAVGGTILNAAGVDCVRDVFKKRVSQVARIHVGDRTVVCSADHRFFTRRGWVPAAELQSGDLLVQTAAAVHLVRRNHHAANTAGSPEAVLQSILLSEMAAGTAGRDRTVAADRPFKSERSVAPATAVSLLRSELRAVQNSTASEILLPGVFFDLAYGPAGTSRKAAQPDRKSEDRREKEGLVCCGLAASARGYRADFSAQSDAQRGVSVKGCSDTSAARRSSEVGWRERARNDLASTSFAGGVGACLAGGISGADQAASAGFAELPLSGPRGPGLHDCDRSGRRYAPDEDRQRARREERSVSVCSRVDRVEVLECGHPELDQYRDAAGDIYFYDLTASLHPSFSVGGLLVHNCLRSYGSKTFQEFLPLFSKVLFKLVATATPSPNRYKELIHYAGFLGVMDTGLALTRWFQRNSEKAGDLTLYPHKEDEFWMFIHSFCAFLQRPSELGYSDEGYELPPLKLRWHEVPADHSQAEPERDGQGVMFRAVANSLQEAAKSRRDSLSQRIAKMSEIIAQDPDSHRILWHDLEAEREAIEAALPEVVTISGSMDIDAREVRLHDFEEGRTKYFGTKPILSGSGSNFQYHCHKAIYVALPGYGYKFNDFIQSLYRLQRFGQQHLVEVDIIYSEDERAGRAALEEKWTRDIEMRARMSEIIKKHGLDTLPLRDRLARSIGIKRVEIKGERFTAINNDAVAEARTWPENSVDQIITSIPFSNHYEYSASYNDFGHTDDNGHFWGQMDFLTTELLRMLKPGRLACIHVKDRVLFGSVTGEGVPTISPFHAEAIMHYRAHGFQYMGMIHVNTDVVRENNQTYRLGWSECCKDGTKMGVGSPEYVLLLRKPQSDRSRGYADVPVVKNKEDYTRARWQIDAHSFWRSSGDRFLTAEEFSSCTAGDLARLFAKTSADRIYNYEAHVKIGEDVDLTGTLPATFMAIAPGATCEDTWHDVQRMRTLNMLQQRKGAEMHLCPLQFDIVDRLIERYSNEGDLIYDPFGGLMTVPYRALLKGRRGAATELNAGYFMDGVHYCRMAEEKITTPALFDLAAFDQSLPPPSGHDGGER